MDGIVLIFLLLFSINCYAKEKEEFDKYKVSAGADFSSFINSKGYNINFGGDLKLDKSTLSLLAMEEGQSNSSINYFQRISQYTWNSKTSLENNYEVLTYARYFKNASSFTNIPFQDAIESIGIGYKYSGFVSSVSVGGRQNNYGSGAVVRLATSYERKLMEDTFLKTEIAYLKFAEYSNLAQFSMKISKEVSKHFEILLLLNYEIEEGLPATLLNRTATTSQTIEKQKYSFGVNFKI